VLAGASWDCWAAYYERVEHDLLDDGRFGAIKEWGNKQPGRVARLAGLLHLATQPDPSHRQINVATITAACQLGEYFEAHALATYDLMGTLPELEGARRILAWVRRKRLATFTERDAAQAFRAGSAGRFFGTLEDVRACLCLLLEHGYLRRGISAARGGPGRPPSPSYQVHPRFLSSSHQKHQNSNSDVSDDARSGFAPRVEEGTG
jgi:replicative DNA helicase